MVGQWLDIAAGANFGPVVVGGFLGGLLQPIVAKLHPQAANPAASNYWQSPLLGIAAAGISVYVLADSADGEPLRVLFFSLLCGLGFPAVLTSAIDKMGQRTREVTQEMAQIANNARSDGIDDTRRAAQQLRTVLSQNPPDSVKPEGQNLIETVAQQAVANIAQTPADTATLERQVVEELKEVGTVAMTAGWDNTAQAAADQLRILSQTITDRTARAAAGTAADRLTEVAP
jgi:hypothetical protein